MNKTKIEWVKNPDGTQGYTWNPITGCLNHNNGMCRGGSFPCYAYKLAYGRLKERYLVTGKGDNYLPPQCDKDIDLLDKALDDPFYPRFWPDRLGDRGLFQNKPKGIFVCDMSDLFGCGVPENWTDRVVDQIKVHRQHRYYLLTKQPNNLPTSPVYFPNNCWVGATVTNRVMLNMAAGSLAQIKAKIKYICFEPLLNSVDKSLAWASYLSMLFKEGWLNWVIIGAQTNPYKKPEIQWVREIIEVCDKVGMPVFLKDNLRWPRLSADGSPPFYKYDKVLGTWELRQEMPVIK